MLLQFCSGNGHEKTCHYNILYKDWKWKVYLNVITLFQTISLRQWNTNVTRHPCHFTSVYLFGDNSTDYLRHGNGSRTVYTCLFFRTMSSKTCGSVASWRRTLTTLSSWTWTHWPGKNLIHPERNPFVSTNFHPGSSEVKFICSGGSDPHQNRTRMTCQVLWLTWLIQAPFKWEDNILVAGPTSWQFMTFWQMPGSGHQFQVLA